MTVLCKLSWFKRYYRQELLLLTDDSRHYPLKKRCSDILSTGPPRRLKSQESKMITNERQPSEPYMGYLNTAFCPLSQQILLQSANNMLMEPLKNTLNCSSRSTSTTSWSFSKICKNIGNMYDWYFKNSKKSASMSKEKSVNFMEKKHPSSILLLALATCN